MTEPDLERWQHFLWQKWLSEAADKAGISITTLENRLASGEAVLEIRAIIDPNKRHPT